MDEGATRKAPTGPIKVEDLAGWKVYTYQRSTGGLYKMWAAPTGQRYRTLREATEEGFLPPRV